MIDRSVPRGLPALLAALLIGACGTPATVPEDRFYRLSAPAVERQDAPVLDNTLVVGPVAAYDVYRDRAIAYSPFDEPGALQHHHYHFWIAPPPELVREQVVEYLRQSGIATEVTTGSPGRNSQSIHLAARLTRFERLPQADGSVRFAVGLDIALDDNGQVLLRRRYERVTMAADASFPATVAAANEGLEQIYAALTGDVRATLETPSR